jgi:hypothetical protein
MASKKVCLTEMDSMMCLGCWKVLCMDYRKALPCVHKLY